MPLVIMTSVCRAVLRGLVGSQGKDGKKGELEDLLVEAGLKGPTPVESLRSLYRVLHVVNGEADCLKGDDTLFCCCSLPPGWGREVTAGRPAAQCRQLIYWAPFVRRTLGRYCGGWQVVAVNRQISVGVVITEDVCF